MHVAELAADIELVSVRGLAGPNLWSDAPVLQVVLRASGLGEWEAADAGRLAATLRTWLPDLPECIVQHGAAGPPQHGRGAAWALATGLAEATLALQNLAGSRLSFACVEATAQPDVFRVVVEYEEEKVGRACLAAAQRFCIAALEGRWPDVPGETAKLRLLRDEIALGTTTGALVAAARARGIPFRRLDEMSLVQLGHGARQHRIMTAVTDRTSKIAEAVSLDKELSKTLLRELGVPVPVGRGVVSAEDAWTAAGEVGLPVVVKPRSADYGHGVGLNLTTAEQVAAAYRAARAYGDEVIVERFAPGDQYRVTVVGGQVVAAVHRVAPSIVGDGRSTVAQLIAAANRDPRRGDGDAFPLDFIGLDDDTEALLAEQGLALDRVPAANVPIVLSRICHTWAGASVADVTDQMHRRTAAQCATAAKAIGLDVAGIDLVACDISRPLEEQGGAILEVNAGPAIALHFTPFCDKHRPVCETILDSLFPAGDEGRIPVVLVCGREGNPAASRAIARLLRSRFGPICRASAEGLDLDDFRVKSGSQANLAGTRAALFHPDARAAVLERSFQGIADEGLGLDRVAAVVLAGEASGAAGRSDAPTRRTALEQAVARLLAAVVDDDGFLVLDADDPQFDELAGNSVAARLAALLEQYAVAAAVELHPRHERPHQHYPAAAGDFEPVGAGGVGQAGRVEPLALVGNLDPQQFGREPARDVDPLRRV